MNVKFLLFAMRFFKLYEKLQNRVKNYNFDFISFAIFYLGKGHACKICIFKLEIEKWIQLDVQKGMSLFKLALISITS